MDCCVFVQAAQPNGAPAYQFSRNTLRLVGLAWPAAALNGEEHAAAWHGLELLPGGLPVAKGQSAAMDMVVEGGEVAARAPLPPQNEGAERPALTSPPMGS